MNTRRSIFAICILAVGLLGEDCDPFGNDGMRGETSVEVIADPDSRCVALTRRGAALAFADSVPAAAWVLDPVASAARPFDVSEAPPVTSTDVTVLATTSGGEFGTLHPQADGTIALTLTGVEVYQQFTTLPPTPTLEAFDVPVPNAVFPQLSSGNSISTLACVDFSGVDSRGDTIVNHTNPLCAATPGFDTNLTSAAAINGGRLFVTAQNLGEAGDGDPQYFPGTVASYKLTPVVPGTTQVEAESVIVLDGFNPIGAVAFSDSLRNFVLVLVGGAIAAVVDDESTPTVVEQGFESRTPASLQLIDADIPAVVASLDLGMVPFAAGLILDDLVSPQIAVAGTLDGRRIYAFDLDAIAANPTDPLSSDVLLTPGGFGFAGRTTGADPSICAGQVTGLAFNDAGDKLFATDFCDGVVAEIAVDTVSDPPSLSNTTKYVFADRIDSDDETTPKGLAGIAVRPLPHDDDGADVFVLVSQPEGMMCGLDIDTGPGV